MMRLAQAFPDGMDFRILVPRFNTLEEQTLQRVLRAELAVVGYHLACPSVSCVLQSAAFSIPLKIRHVLLEQASRFGNHVWCL